MTTILIWLWCSKSWFLAMYSFSWMVHCMVQKYFSTRRLNKKAVSFVELWNSTKSSARFSRKLHESSLAINLLVFLLVSNYPKDSFEYRKTVRQWIQIIAYFIQSCLVQYVEYSIQIRNVQLHFCVFDYIFDAFLNGNFNFITYFDVIIRLLLENVQLTFKVMNVLKLTKERWIPFVY